MFGVDPAPSEYLNGGEEGAGLKKEVLGSPFALALDAARPYLAALNDAPGIAANLVSVA